MRLTEIQRSVLEEIVRSGITEKFYLAGGTALMMRYHHRFSEDFDFFLLPDEKFNFLRILSNLSETYILDQKEDTLIFEKNTVRCSFFRYDCQLLGPVVKVQGYGVRAASDEDIASMKAIAIIQRGEKKDFFDLWYLMRHHEWMIEDIVGFCRTKYGEHFNPGLLFKALTFFDDAEPDKIRDIDPRWDEIKRYFVKQVKEKILD